MVFGGGPEAGSDQRVSAGTTMPCAERIRGGPLAPLPREQANTKYGFCRRIPFGLSVRKKPETSVG